MFHALKPLLLATCLLLMPVLGLGDSDSISTVTLNLDSQTLNKSVETLSGQTGVTYIIAPDILDRRGPGVQMKDVSSDLAIAVVAAAYQVCFKQLIGPDRVTGIFTCRDNDLPAT